MEDDHIAPKRLLASHLPFLPGSYSTVAAMTRDEAEQAATLGLHCFEYVQIHCSILGKASLHKRSDFPM